MLSTGRNSNVGTIAGPQKLLLPFNTGADGSHSGSIIAFATGSSNVQLQVRVLDPATGAELARVGFGGNLTSSPKVNYNTGYSGDPVLKAATDYDLEVALNDYRGEGVAPGYPDGSYQISVDNNTPQHRDARPHGSWWPF